MTFGAVLDEAWTLYTKFFTRFFVMAVIVFAVVNGLLALVLLGIDESERGAAALFGFISFALGIIGSFWLQGALVYAVQDVRDGTLESSTSTIFRAVRPLVGRLILTGLLAGLGIGVGIILFLVPGLFLLTIWAVVAPVVVIENRQTSDAFRRSRELVRGNGWTVFFVVVVTTFVSIIASALVSGAFSFLPAPLEVFVGYTVAQSIVAPFGAVALSVLFFKLRAAHGGVPVLA